MSKANGATVAEDIFGGNRVLVTEVHGRFCAVPLIHVVEIMRPLPIEAIAGAPSFVRGVSIIRGVPTPVIDLGILLGTHNDEAPVGMSGRFITLRLGERQAALSVDSICDVLELDAMTTQELPPLLQGASNNFIETITTLDAHMLVILRSGWQLPDAIWRSLATPGPAQISVGEIITNEISERA